jgi:hypothetical protein
MAITRRANVHLAILTISAEHTCLGEIRYATTATPNIQHKRRLIAAPQQDLQRRRMLPRFPIDGHIGDRELSRLAFATPILHGVKADFAMLRSTKRCCYRGHRFRLGRPRTRRSYGCEEEKTREAGSHSRHMLRQRKRRPPRERRPNDPLVPRLRFATLGMTKNASIEAGGSK